LKPKHIQTRLIEPMLTDSWPENHKLKMPKKQWLDYYKPKEETFNSILERIDELGRETYIVALSGGKDSGVVLDKLYKLGKKLRGFYIKTNTGIKPTEDFVKDTCQKYGIRLDIREPTPHSHVYVAIVCEIGFPDAGMHDMIMSYLKYKTMMKYVTEPEFKTKRPVLMSGVRKFESERRKFNYNEPINVDSKKLWFCCPVFYETDNEVYQYYVENGIKKSRAYDYTDSSLECGCGTFGNKKDMEAIKILDPDRYAFFQDLTEFVRKHGTPLAKRHLTWGGEGWNETERNEVLTKYLGDKYAHAVNVAQMVCGSECGSTMRGLESI